MTVTVIKKRGVEAQELSMVENGQRSWHSQVSEEEYIT